MTPLELTTEAHTICEVVRAHFHLSSAQINSKSTDRQIVGARQIVWYLLYTMRGATYPAIAAKFNMVPTSVRHGVIHVCDLISTDRKFAEVVTMIESRCKLLLESANHNQ